MFDKNKREKKQRIIFLLSYTVFFILCAAAVFHYFPEAGKRMVWKGDGLSQHYVALCYYARWGRAVLRSLVSGHPEFPTLNMHMGFGSDLFTTLEYYVIGDPFSLPAVFVPQRHMVFFHDAMILLRLYLAGICFDRYCRCMGHGDPAGNLCGALLYVFSTFALFGMRHPYFLNAMIWFPLLLIGAEEIFSGGRGRRFAFAVFLACISNFYFFYMLVALTMVYVVWRALRRCGFLFFGRNREGGASGAFRELLFLAMKFLVRGAQGAAMGAVFLLPVILRFLQDPRTSEGVPYGLLYAQEYYRNLPEAFISFGTDVTLSWWTCLGFGGPGLIAVFLLFMDTAPAEQGSGSGAGGKGWGSRKAGMLRHVDLKIAFAAMLLMTALPFAGAALNGFSYPANRWTWAFALLVSYIAAVMLPSIAGIGWRKLGVLLLLLAAYGGVCAFLGASGWALAETAAAAAAAVLAAAIGRGISCEKKAGKRFDGEEISVSGSACREKNSRETGKGFSGGEKPDGMLSGDRKTGRGIFGAAFTAVLLFHTAATAGIHAYIDFVPGRENSSLAEYHTDRYIEAMKASDAAGMRQLIGNDTFYRYSGRALANNFSILHDVSNTQYYWSLSDAKVVRFFEETGQSNGMVHLYDNLDNRTMTDELAGVKYQIRNDGSLLPFGYEKLEGLHYDTREIFEKREEDPIPVTSFSVYENRYALPFGFTSDKFITREAYDSMSIPQRQEALMQGILVEADLEKVLSGEGGGLSSSEGGISGAVPVFTVKEIPFSTAEEEGIRMRELPDSAGGVQVEVTKPGATLCLKLQKDEAAQCETGVLFEGMSYEAELPEGGAEEVSTGGSSVSMSAESAKAAAEESGAAGQSNGGSSASMSAESAKAAAEESGAAGQSTGGSSASSSVEVVEEPAHENTEPVEIVVKAKRGGRSVSRKVVSYTLPDNPWKTGRSDFLSCCGYAEEPIEEIRLGFSRIGSYTFSRLCVIGQPMEEYPEQAEALQECVLENIDLHELSGSGATSRITGRISVPPAEGTAAGKAEEAWDNSQSSGRQPEAGSPEGIEEAGENSQSSGTQPEAGSPEGMEEAWENSRSSGRQPEAGGPEGMEEAGENSQSSGRQPEAGGPEERAEKTGDGEKTEAAGGGRLLCLQIPLMKGLRAFVDGVEQPLYQADTMFCALILKPGIHEIELVYRTPGLFSGAGISAAAFLLFILELLLEKMTDHRRRGKGIEEEKE